MVDFGFASIERVGCLNGVKNGSYDTLTVGLAKNLEGDIYVEGKTYFKPTATVLDDSGEFTSEEVGSGPASIESIQGNTVVWNQMVENGDFSDGTTGWNIVYGSTYEVIDGIYHSVKTGEPSYSGAITPISVVFNKEHKYMVIYRAKGSSSGNIVVSYMEQVLISN